jgi:hypothetical protein
MPQGENLSNVNSFDRHLPALRHRIPGVHNQIDDDLFDLPLIRHLVADARDADLLYAKCSV